MIVGIPVDPKNTKTAATTTRGIRMELGSIVRLFDSFGFSEVPEGFLNHAGKHLIEIIKTLALL